MSLNSSQEESLGESPTTTSLAVFDLAETLKDLKHYLPAQLALKDFVHHNTLHAFQGLKFFNALSRASELFGYRVTPSLREFRALYQSNRIHDDIINRVIEQEKGPSTIAAWREKLISQTFYPSRLPRVGRLRANWKRHYRIDLDSLVHSTLFRVICSYLDQGIAMWKFPVSPGGFLASLRELENNSYTSFFRTKRATDFLLHRTSDITTLLKLLVGDESLYKQYIFDQQFAHQGWSGMVASVEDHPESLLDERTISLHDIIYFELLLEIDALDSTFGETWRPLAKRIRKKPLDPFRPTKKTELDEVLSLWQLALEWTYYDQALSAITSQRRNNQAEKVKSFQSIFCVDDRGCSFRKYLELFDDGCETFGTPGFFNVEFFFQPANGKSYTKLCPAPITPKYLIKEKGSDEKQDTDLHLANHSHTLLRGWLITQTMGFISAVRLLKNIFQPSESPAAASSFSHMNKAAALTIENKDSSDIENGLQIGFTIIEMADRVEGLLRSIGLIKNFSPLVYVIGHGASSVNNPHYAAYDCGACAGRPGSVNARVICHMANHPEVRSLLHSRGLHIPDTTRFIGGLHDTTRDEIEFFDKERLDEISLAKHLENKNVFNKALDANSKERSRRFDNINTRLPSDKIHDKVRLRSVSLFEPRPELNHATNALCVVGRRSLTKNLFLDRRAFLNSYDYALDPNGDLLFHVIKPLGPVCGGINLEYFFSKVDNQKLGAGSKLPHNVMGLLGVANGIEGDLRPGLPIQMTEVHDPVRLLLIVEQLPQIVLEVIHRSPEVYEWYGNEWIHLAVIDPRDGLVHQFINGEFQPYQPLQLAPITNDVKGLIESTSENIPPHIIRAS